MHAALVAISLLALSGPQQKISEVQGSDLCTRLRVIGSLGVPLGERVRIRGEWYVPEEPRFKADSLNLRITEVNGKPIKKAVSIPDWSIDSMPFTRPPARQAGEQWEAEGYESGTFYGEPEWVTPEHFPDAGKHGGLRLMPRFFYLVPREEKASGR